MTLSICYKNPNLVNSPGRWQSKTLIVLTNVDKKSSICRQIGDKLQSNTLFLSIFDPRSSIVKSVFDCRLSGVVKWFYYCIILCMIQFEVSSVLIVNSKTRQTIINYVCK